MADNPVLETVELFYPTPEESEPTEPTETDDATKPEGAGEDQDTIKNTDEPVEGEEVEAKTEEAESEDESETTEDQEEEPVYLELDGKEVDLDEVRQWRDGHLMQSDYTRKTTELAKERDEVSTIKSSLVELQAELQALIQEDDATDWEELREYEPEKYIEAKEKADKRKAAAEKFKNTSAPTLTQSELKKEQDLLFSANPTWLDAKGNQTKAMKEDSELLAKYWQDHGFTEAEVAGMYRARYIEASLKAAKFDQLQADSKKFVKKAKKATLVTKPKAKGKKVDNKPKSYADLIYNS